MSDQKLTRRGLVRHGALSMSAAALGATLAASNVNAASPDVSDAIKTSSVFGLRSDQSAPANRKALQNAIDWASSCGGMVFIEPTDEPYAVESGVVLRQNASLIGVNAAVPRGTSHPQKPQPVGSVFRIESEDQPFITVESATQLRGLQFWYPAQTRTNPTKVIEYPPTVARSPSKPVFGVNLIDLTFFGDFMTFDFTSPKANEGKITELIRVEHCYAYPLSGRFFDLTHCYDIPRVLHCHVNPAIRRLIDGDLKRDVIDSVIARKTYAYRIDRTDNAQLMDLFTFGTYGGIWLGEATYGQLTNFNLDCVVNGIYKGGDSQFNRNWQIAQGSIIANCGKTVHDNHPIIIEGKGHTTLSAVESFSGPNGAITTPTIPVDGKDLTLSQDYLCINGSEELTISLLGCRMAHYYADDPITINNPNAQVIAQACFARRAHGPKTVAYHRG